MNNKFSLNSQGLEVIRILICGSITVFSILLTACSSRFHTEAPTFDLEIEQLTFGKKHHFFGYIGQCRTIPWNESGRYILGLEIDRIDRMPEPEDTARVFIIDTEKDNKINVSSTIRND